MEKKIIIAERRTIVGKKVNTLRREGKLPAIIYGHRIDAIPVTLNARDTQKTLNQVSGSTILTIDLQGEEFSTLIREIQRDHIKGNLLHIDFLAISMKEKLRTAVSLTQVGDAAVLDKYPALLVTGIEEVEVECFPQDLPESIEVDVSNLQEIGDAIYVKDVQVPNNVEIITDPEELVIVVSAVKEEAVEEVEELVEEGVEGSEPAVIEHGKKEEESEEES